MKTTKIFSVIVFCLSLSFSIEAQTKTVYELRQEVDNYLTLKSRELTSQGKRMTADQRNDLVIEQKALAKKYADEAATRPNLAGNDFYHLGLLYYTAENDVKALDALKKFLAQNPPDAKGDLIQSARSYGVIIASQRKQMTDAEQFFQTWVSGSPSLKGQQPLIENNLAVGFFKDGQYDNAIKYGQEAFDMLKTLEAKTPKAKYDKEQIYMNLVEVLSLSYKKNKNAEAALNILAEARARSFTLPSANLYRKVMTFVQGSGFSEKKLMQKVESYPTADPVPELKFVEWIGQEPATLENFRGKVVLLDFWATWCGPCISTFPRLRDWHKKYAGKDFAIVGVTKFYGQGDGKQLTRLQEIDFLNDFRQKYKIPYTFAVADSSEDSMKYGINAYPTTVLIDRNGVVRYIGIGASVEESENLEDMIKETIKEQPKTAVAP